MTLYLQPRSAPLLLGARPLPLSIDIFCPHGAQQQTHCCGRIMGQTDRQTDGRTLDRFIDHAPHTMRTLSITQP